MTPDITTEYCALVHIKTTGCGDDFPCSRRFLHAHAWRYASVSNGCQEGKLGDGVVPQKTLLSFTDIPKSQTLIPLKSQKTVGYCWRIYFHATGLRLVLWIPHSPGPSMTAYARHILWHFGVRQQYRKVFQDTFRTHCGKRCNSLAA